MYFGLSCVVDKRVLEGRITAFVDGRRHSGEPETR